MPQTHDLGRLFVTSLRLSDDAPLFHRAMTAEYNHGGRNCPWSIIIRTPFRRAGRWHGIRRSWLSFQVKLPTGAPLLEGQWGIVLGWWKYPDDDGWSALLKVFDMGRSDKADDREFTDPEFKGSRKSRGIGIVLRRRVDDSGHAGTDE